jgi:hypothetical protein
MARLLFVLLVATAATATALEFPGDVPATKCKGKKKIFAVIDDPTSTPSVRRIKMKNSFYLQAGSIFVQGCRTAKGSDQCQEAFGLGLLLTPGFTGEIPCNSEAGLPYLSYNTSSDTGGTYWTNTGECVVTIAKYDEQRGRLQGTYRSQVLTTVGGEIVYGQLLGCFKAKRQQLSPD